jgi:hypothetical protein
MRIGHWDITFLFSLTCSLLINSGMVGVVVLRAQPPGVIDLNRWHTRVVPTPTPEILPPPPQKQIDFDNRDTFGEHQATGQALNSSPGDQPLLSMKADEIQAFLGRNPPVGAGGGGGGPILIGAASPQQAAVPHVKPAEPPVNTPPQPKQSVADTSEGNTGDDPPPSPPKATPPRQNTNASAAAAAQNPPGTPGPRSPAAANPTPPSDKDSDPFSDANSFRFVNGRVDARNGRWVKTVKPHITDAGILAAELMAHPAVEFLATVDEQGNVIHVDRYRSSGSDYIDLPCEEALSQWKIEPSKDRNGRPVQDVVSITFVFY